MAPMWKKLMKKTLILTGQLHFLITYTRDAPKLRKTKRFSNHEFLLEQLTNYQGGKSLTQRRLRDLTTWKTCSKYVERFCELANKKTEQLSKVSSPCLDGLHSKKEDASVGGDLPKVCSQIVLKCLYLARIGRPDILRFDQSLNGQELVTDE